MAEDDYPDVEEGVRQYLRDDADVNAVVSRRVFFGVPKEVPQFPLVTVRRVGGGDDSSEAAVDLAVLSINCWGTNTKTSAWSTASAVRKALRKIRGRTLLTTGVYAHGTTVDGVIWAPDPEDARPRYIVTVRVTATAA